MDNSLLELAAVIGLGVGATWLGWRLRVPSILLLLSLGFIAGPVADLLDPDSLLGDLLFPLVSLAVALVLFEGGLSLRFTDVRGHGRVVTMLVTAGVAITWLVASVAARFLLDIDWPVSLLLGSVVLVSGPTVVGPLLRHIRPPRRVASILNWESIVIDPIGVVLAVLIFQGISAGDFQTATAGAVLDFLTTVGIGVAAGGVAAAGLVLVMRRYWVPDFLQAPMTLAVVVVAFALSNTVQEEAGLLTVVVLGVALSNQRLAVVSHIRGFKEDLRVVLIGALFILLAARIELSQLSDIWLPSMALVAVLVLVARPIAVAISTRRSGLNFREKAFLAWLAPRGIVAAAASAIFSFELEQNGVAGADKLLAATFLVIVGTVVLYGVTGPLVARFLKLSAPAQGGLLILGAHRAALLIARELAATGHRIVMVDTNPNNVSQARLTGLEAVHANVLSDYALDEIELHAVTSLLALSSNDEANTLAAHHFVEAFGANRVFQLRPARTDDPARHEIAPHHRGRLLFAKNLDHDTLEETLQRGGSIETIPGARYLEMAKGDRTPWPLFILTGSGAIRVVADADEAIPRAHDEVVILTRPPGG